VEPWNRESTVSRNQETGLTAPLGALGSRCRAAIAIPRFVVQTAKSNSHEIRKTGLPETPTCTGKARVPNARRRRFPRSDLTVMVLPKPSYLSENDESYLVHSPFFPGSMFSGNRVTLLPWPRGSCVIGEPGKTKGKKTRGLMIGESRKRASRIAPTWSYHGSPKMDTAASRGDRRIVFDQPATSCRNPETVEA
jgi:hypothetical protein